MFLKPGHCNVPDTSVFQRPFPTWRSWRFVALLAIILCVATAARAAPAMTWLYPAGGTYQRETVVTVGGDHKQWPPTVWIENSDALPGVSITPMKDKGKLKVTLGELTTSNQVRFRLYDDTGATPLRSFVIDALPSVMEKETNGGPSPDKSQSVELPATVDGRLGKRGDVDAYAVTLQQGQTFVAAVLANRVIASPMDAILQLVDERGNVIAQNDEGYGLDPLIVYTAAREGTYVVRVYAYPETPSSSLTFSGGDDHIYRLTMTTGPYVDQVQHVEEEIDTPAQFQVSALGWNLPVTLTGQVDYKQLFAAGLAVQPNAGQLLPTFFPVHFVQPGTDAAQPTPIGPDICAVGVIARPKQTHHYVLDVTDDLKGKAVMLSVVAREAGSPLDARLAVADPDGKVVHDVDDTEKLPDPSIVFSPTKVGPYGVTVRDTFSHGGPRYAYRLTARNATPDFDIDIKGGEHVLTPGKPLTLDVTVNRRHGFAKVVRLALGDTNVPGVSLKAAESKAKGDSAKSVKVTLSAEKGRALWSGPMTIVATDDDGAERRVSIWLTVLKS